MTMVVCPDCESINIRTFSNFNNERDAWEWLNGCNDCEWEARNEDEEKLHPEYYTRMPESPGKISSSDIVI